MSCLTCITCICSHAMCVGSFVDIFVMSARIIHNVYSALPSTVEQAKIITCPRTQNCI